MQKIDPVALVGLQQQFHGLVLQNPELVRLVNRAPSELFAMCLLTMQQDYRADEGDLIPTYTNQEAAARASQVIQDIADALDAFEDGEDTEITPVESN